MTTAGSDPQRALHRARSTLLLLFALSPAACRLGVPHVIYLARHGQTEYNRVSRLQGDPDLDAVGYLDRVGLWLLLKDRPIREIYTSELQRTQRTAALVARERGIELRVRSALNEIQPGVFEGLCYGWLMPDHREPGIEECMVPARGSRSTALLPRLRPLAAPLRDKRSLTVKLPQGESYADVIARTTPFVEELSRRAQGDEILIVAHGVVNRVLLHQLGGWSMPQVRRVRQHNGQVFRIENARTPAARVFLYTPGRGWTRCTPPGPGDRGLDCSPPEQPPPPATPPAPPPPAAPPVAQPEA